MRRITLISVLIAGCAQQPMPTAFPPPDISNQRCIKIPGEGCQRFTAGNVGGTTLGNTNEEPIEKDRP